MNKLILAVAACILLLVSCSKDRISGNGANRTEDRNTDVFTKVSTSGSTNVYITQGTIFKVQVRGYENLLSYMQTNVVNGELRIGYRNSTSVRNDNVEVFVTLPVLEGISISGSASADAKGTFASNRLGLSISGAGEINVESGAVQTLDAEISGSGNIRVFGVVANEANVTMSGSGTTEVNAAAKLKVNISGSGTAYYKGTPVVETSISGSGRVVHKP